MFYTNLTFPQLSISSVHIILYTHILVKPSLTSILEYFPTNKILTYLADNHCYFQILLVLIHHSVDLTFLDISYMQTYTIYSISRIVSFIQCNIFRLIYIIASISIPFLFRLNHFTLSAKLPFMTPWTFMLFVLFLLL